MTQDAVSGLKGPQNSGVCPQCGDRFNIQEAHVCKFRNSMPVDEERPPFVPDFTQADIYIFTPERGNDPLVVCGFPDSSVGPLEAAWDAAEDILFPARKTRLKWEMAKELFGGR